MAHVPEEVHRLFAQQHGVVALTQLRQFLSMGQVRRFEEGGSIVNFIRGVYRSPSWPVGELTRCAAVCLGRPYVAIAGPTAGRLWEYRRVPRDQRIHVVAPPATKPVDVTWVRAYRTAAIRDEDIVERPDGIRITSRGRTALDLSRFVGPDDLLSIIEQAMRDGRLSETAMMELAVDFISPQRPWLNTYLRQFDRRSHGGPAESHPEVRLGLALESAGVVGLERQHRVLLPGYGPARFDLAVPRLRWAIEVDVHPSHTEFAGQASDERRDAAATSVGWSTSRVTRDQYELDFAGTVAALTARYMNLRAA